MLESTRSRLLRQMLQMRSLGLMMVLHKSDVVIIGFWRAPTAEHATCHVNSYMTISLPTSLCSKWPRLAVYSRRSHAIPLEEGPCELPSTGGSGATTRLAARTSAEDA